MKQAKPDNTHLARLWDALTEVTQEARELLERPKAQLVWKPDEASWNILQCLEHLVVTDHLYIPRIRQTLEKAEARGLTETRPFRQNFFTKLFIDSLRPGRRPVRTFSIFEPQAPADDLSVKEAYLNHQQTLFDLIKQADGFNLNRPKLGSPLTPLLRFSVGEALLLLVVHQQRHLLQAQRLTRHPAFPRTATLSAKTKS